jgi:hypothetical protein
MNRHAFTHVCWVLAALGCRQVQPADDAPPGDTGATPSTAGDTAVDTETGTAAEAAASDTGVDAAADTDGEAAVEYYGCVRLTGMFTLAVIAKVDRATNTCVRLQFVQGVDCSDLSAWKVEGLSGWCTSATVTRDIEQCTTLEGQEALITPELVTGTIAWEGVGLVWMDLTLTFEPVEPWIPATVRMTVDPCHLSGSCEPPREDCRKGEINAGNADVH